MLYKFNKKDLIYNTIKTYPKNEFYIYSGSAIYNGQFLHSGAINSRVNHVPSGYISLDEINVDRPANQLIYPFVIKNSSLDAFQSISNVNFFAKYQYGDVISGSYPLSSSISKEYYQQGQVRPNVNSLLNSLSASLLHSPHYAYSSSYGNKSTQALGLINIPTIFYGSSIKKGSVNLRYYLTGTLIGELQDKNKNGELIEVSGSSTGSVAGVVLYKQGFVILTGSWDLSSNQDDLIGDPTNLQTPKWTLFGNSISGSVIAASSSFRCYFEGTNNINTLTMLTHLRKGELNHSNNPTFIKYNQNQTAITGNTLYKEPDELQIKNIVSSSYYGHTGSFQRITYVDSVKIMDKDKNIIAIAKLARPARKKETDNYLLKIKLDLL